MPFSDTKVARKSRSYRARRKAGAIVVPVEVAPDTQQALVSNGFLDDADRHDRAWIAAGIVTLLEFLSEGAIVPIEDTLD